MRSGGASDPRAELLRRIEGVVTGDVEVEIVVEPEFDYGEVAPWLRVGDDGRVTAIGSDNALVVHATVEWGIDRVESRLLARQTVRAGESIHVMAVAQDAHLIDPAAADAGCVDAHIDETIEWWKTWSNATTVDGPHADLVERSALVLKSLNSALTGAIIAAPTTSLPEIIGGTYNWDYGYCWVRDATLALQALSMVGHDEMAQGFRDFIMRSAAGHGAELQIDHPWIIRFHEAHQRQLQQAGIHRGRSEVLHEVGAGRIQAVGLDCRANLVTHHLTCEVHRVDVQLTEVPAE